MRESLCYLDGENWNSPKTCEQDEDSSGYFTISFLEVFRQNARVRAFHACLGYVPTSPEDDEDNKFSDRSIVWLVCPDIWVGTGVNYLTKKEALNRRVYSWKLSRQFYHSSGSTKMLSKSYLAMERACVPVILFSLF